METVYVGSPTKRADPGKKEKSVAIAAGKKPVLKRTFSKSVELEK